MSYIDKTLVPGEKVVYTTRLHWIVMLGHIILALIAILAGAFLFYYASYHRATLQKDSMHVLIGGGIVLLVAGLVIFFAGSVRRNATEMAVTTRRVVIKKGLTSRTTIEMLLNKVETIEVSEPTLGRMMGYGSITMVGTGGTSEPFHKMSHPLEFRSAVQQEIEKLMPQEPPPPPQKLS
ncbi:MAG TPA: PH domain-containing protein [Acidobacteriaceae bacterium]|nr:PH domain-containing protein [Acidobacteriaceae bacterium]